MVLPSTYRLTIAGIERELPVVEVASGLAIASFVILGDAELMEKLHRASSRFPSVEHSVG